MVIAFKQRISKLLLALVGMLLMVALSVVVVYAEDEVYEEDYDPVTVYLMHGTEWGGGLIDTIVIQRNGTVRPENPEMDGYEFRDWYADAECDRTFNFNEPISADETYIYAKWEAVEEDEYIYIMFESPDEGYYDYQPLRPGIDKPAVPEGEPLKYGCKFAGWYADSECTIPFDFDSTYTEDTFVYAKWLQYTVEVEKVRGVYTAIVWPEDEVTGYQWYGYFMASDSWEPIEGATEKTFAGGLSGREYYCEVTFNGVSTLPSNDFEYVKTYFITMVFPTYTSKVPIDEGKSFTQSYPDIDYTDISREHHTFLGWYRSDDEGQTFETEIFDFDQVINENISIYSIFEIDKYKVTYKVDGVTVKEILVPYGSDATAPEIPEKDGYTAAWDNDGTAITGERTINAVYTLIQSSGGGDDLTSPDDNIVDGNLGASRITYWALISVACICLVGAGTVIYTKKREY